MRDFFFEVFKFSDDAHNFSHELFYVLQTTLHHTAYQNLQISCAVLSSNKITTLQQTAVLSSPNVPLGIHFMFGYPLHNEIIHW